VKITTKKGTIVNTPSIRLETNRKCLNDSKKANKWLLETVKKDYEDDEWISLQLNFMDIKNLSPSDKDILMDLLLPEGTSPYIFELIE